MRDAQPPLVIDVLGNWTPVSLIFTLFTSSSSALSRSAP